MACTTSNPTSVKSAKLPSRCSRAHSCSMPYRKSVGHLRRCHLGRGELDPAGRRVGRGQPDPHRLAGRQPTRCSGPAPAAPAGRPRPARRPARSAAAPRRPARRPPGRRAAKASVRSTQARLTLPATASEAAISSGSVGSAARSGSGSSRPAVTRQADLGAEAVDQPPQRRRDVRVRRPDPAVPRVGGRRGCRPPASNARVAGAAQQGGGRPAQRQRVRGVQRQRGQHLRPRWRRPARRRPAVRRCAGARRPRDGSGCGSVRSSPTPAASMIWAAAIPVSSEISAFQASTSSRLPDLHGPAAVRRAHHLLLGQLQLDRPAAHGQLPAQPAQLGQRRDGRVQPARLVVGLHARVVEPGPGAHQRAAHVDRDRLAGLRPGRWSTAPRPAGRPAAGWPRPRRAPAGAAAPTRRAGRRSARGGAPRRPAGRPGSTTAPRSAIA